MTPEAQCIAIAEVCGRKFLMGAVAAVALAGCAEKEFVLAPSGKTNLPPGFSVVRDTNLGLFAPMVDGEVKGGLIHSNKQGAIDHAWALYEYRRTNGMLRSWSEVP